MMSKKIIQITPAVVQELFETDSIDDSFIAFDDFKQVIFSNGKINDNILNFPFRANEVILVICTQGKLKATLGLNNILLEKNGLLVSLPKQIFEIKEISSDFGATIIIMKTSFFDVRDNLAQIKELQQYVLKNHCLQIPEKALQEILTLFSLIREKIDTHHIYRKEIIQHYFHILCYDFYAFVKEEKMGKPEEKSPLKKLLFDRFIALVEQHYKTQHEIGFYAEKLCLTSKYLSALVHEISGKSAADWIKEYLLLEARTLLKSGKMTIQQVCNELNFNDQSYFTVFFKRYMGCSPREYRKK